MKKWLAVCAVIAATGGALSQLSQAGTMWQRFGWVNEAKAREIAEAVVLLAEAPDLTALGGLSRDEWRCDETKEELEHLEAIPDAALTPEQRARLIRLRRSYEEHNCIQYEEW